MEDELKSTVKFTEHLFDGSGNKIMNSIQYTAMSIVPLLMVNNVLETQLPSFSHNTPPISMIIETAVHMIVLLIVLYFVDRTIRYFPSATGDKYSEVSFETIGLLLVLMVVNSQNSHLGKKVIHLTRHARERFTNREGKTETSDNTQTEPMLPPKTPPPHPPPVSETNNPAETLKKEEGFTQRGGVTPMSALESFAVGGGNYSTF
jgi:hypothetical protein